MSAINMAKRTAAGTLALAVCLGGGALALAGAAQADANFKFDARIAGDTRYGTAIAASKAAFPDGTKTDNVVLVNGFATVDGLTASYLAGVANAPILYVSDQGADADTKAEIKRLGAKNVWLVGGTTVIPAGVEAAIKGDGYNVTRINGSDRYETAKLIAEAGAKIAGKQPAKVFVASGTSFADALAVSPIAYAKGYAIALTDKDSTSDFTKKELGNIGTDNKVLVGGTAVVSDKVKADLSITNRISGDDRAVTANLVADWAKSTEGFSKANAALVGGTNGNGADSLVAASVLGKSSTTLHFAGWDATSVYLKDHSAELTGKSFVFGGSAAVTGDQVNKANTAVQTIAVAKGFTVLTYASGASSFTYSDATAKASATATFASTDKFTVDGGSASIGAFQAALTVGDTVAISTNTPSTGVTTYALVNKTVTSGMIGNIDNSANTAYIIDPITGLALSSSISLVPTNALYKVDGASVSYVAFQAELNEGDALEITGGDGTSVALTRTFSLTSATISGPVASVTGSATVPAFSVKTSAGATLGDDVAGSGNLEYKLASTDVLTVDGTSASVADFNTALTVGDQVTVQRKGGKYYVNLTNAAPTPVQGVVSSVNTTTHVITYYTGTSASSATVDISAVASYKLDGATVTRGELEAAITPGDSLVFQADNTATTSVDESSASLTNQSLMGKVADVQSTPTVDVLYAGTTGVLKNDLNYSSDNVFAGNTARTYFVNGVSKSLAQFTSEMSVVGNGSKLGTLEVVDNGATTEYKLSTTTNNAAATLVGLTNPGHSSATTSVVVTFDKPVYLSDTFAATDFTVMDGATPVAVSAVSPATQAGASNTVTLTITSTTFGSGTTAKVTLNSTGAAKMLDANGTAAVAGSVQVTS